MNIRLARIIRSVQNDFMKRLHENIFYDPQLVYHGTRLINIKSILQYSFLIPNQSHPTNSKAPRITTQNDSSFGSGIYCSTNASYSLSYSDNTNTILVCAALPKRDKAGLIERSHGYILVLSHVSEIIPLFLLDYRYVNRSGTDQLWFNQRYSLRKNDEIEGANKPIIMLRKYLRKVLNHMKDEVQRTRRYRGRRKNRRKVRREEKYQVRVFEPFS